MLPQHLKLESLLFLMKLENFGRDGREKGAFSYSAIELCHLLALMETVENLFNSLESSPKLSG